MAPQNDQTLPAKEAGLFRQVVKHYESKQYKKGIKAADQVLRKFPEHGETLAMKGLIIAFQDKAEAKAEAEDLVKRGLKANLKSHVCWHVYGLLHRADNNYEEATKCYKNALRFDKENLQILRDLAQLQVQTREYAGYIETRKILLGLKASNRQNWISLAVAYHLNEEYDTAVNILSGYEGVQEGVLPGEEYEHSEMLLYKAQVLEEGGMALEALRCLGGSKEHLKDSLSHQEAKARLLLKLERHAEAAATLRGLLTLNPDNYKYHQDLRRALGLLPSASGAWSEKQQQELEALYVGLVEEHPKSTTPARMQLDFLEGEAFEKALDEYVRRFLIKGIPSLYSDLKGLYSSPTKAKSIGSVLLRILKALEEDSSKLPPLIGDSDSGDQKAGEAHLWTRLCLARHYDRLGQTERALELLESCEQQHPDVLEVCMAMGTVLKHAGDLEGAAVASHKAQSLDRADRFLNGAAAKALFRAGRIDEAQKMAWLFINASDPGQTLHDMQCMWYQIELGLAYLRAQNYGKALKNLLAVIKHFATFREDQFDFHTYCMRKMTLRNYISLLRMEDSIMQNQNFAKAAFGAVETYLALADKAPGDAQSQEEEEALLASLSLEERKRHKLKKKKEAQKKAKAEDRQKEAAAEAAAAKTKELAKGVGKGKSDRPATKDPDPDGIELASTSDPLEEASKVLGMLREHAASQLRTHTLSFEVALRKKKHLLALQAVKRGIALVGSTNPEVHRMIIILAKQVLSPGTSHLNGNVKEEAIQPSKVASNRLKHHLENVLAGKSLEQYHHSFVSAHAQTSLPHAAVTASLNVLLAIETQQEAANALAAFSPASDGLPVRQELEDSIDLHQFLTDKLSAPEAAERWKQACQQRFPYSRYFEGDKRTPSSVLDTLCTEGRKER